MADVEINNKIWGFKGAIGRREYILNWAYMSLMLMPLALPYIFWSTLNISELYETSNVLEVFKMSPLYVQISISLAWLLGFPIRFGLGCRRLSDILSKDTDWFIYIAFGIFLLLTYWASLIGNYWILMLSFIIDILLYCLKGKVTGQLPKDEVKRFNWGAFWGTWIWGLINKSYKTLWAIPALILFPIFPYVQIICGIKGNEWAYKKAKNKELEVFHKGQKHQAIFWNIFSGITILVLPVLAFIIITIAAIGYAVANPEKMEQAVQEYAATVEERINENFDKYEIGSDLNKFYINPENWLEMDFEERFTLYNQAVNFAYTKKRSSGDNTRADKEREITKIYSTFNDEILAEFNIDEIDTTSIKTMIETSAKAFKINENPELP